MQYDVLYVDNSTNVILDGLVNNFTKDFINDAYVYCNVFDSSGNLKTGDIFPKTMAYQPNTNGCYRATLSALLNITNGEEVVVEIVAVISEITFTQRIPMLCLDRVTDQAG